MDNSQQLAVSKLHEAIYGFKKSLQARYTKLLNYFLLVGFHNSHLDYSLFIYSYRLHMLLTLIYVDDLIITSSLILMANQFTC